VNQITEALVMAEEHGGEFKTARLNEVTKFASGEYQLSEHINRMRLPLGVDIPHFPKQEVSSKFDTVAIFNRVVEGEPRYTTTKIGKYLKRVTTLEEGEINRLSSLYKADHRAYTNQQSINVQIATSSPDIVEMYEQSGTLSECSTDYPAQSCMGGRHSYEWGAYFDTDVLHPAGCYGGESGIQLAYIYGDCNGEDTVLARVLVRPDQQLMSHKVYGRCPERDILVQHMKDLGFKQSPRFLQGVYLNPLPLEDHNSTDKQHHLIIPYLDGTSSLSYSEYTKKFRVDPKGYFQADGGHYQYMASTALLDNRPACPTCDKRSYKSNGLHHYYHSTLMFCSKKCLKESDEYSTVKGHGIFRNDELGKYRNKLYVLQWLDQSTHNKHGLRTCMNCEHDARSDRNTRKVIVPLHRRSTSIISDNGYYYCSVKCISVEHEQTTNWIRKGRR